MIRDEKHKYELIGCGLMIISAMISMYIIITLIKLWA
jgi:hypothetical protein